MWINEIWLLGTAIVFTGVGMYFRNVDANTLTEVVIDSLIEQGYVKTVGTGRSMEIIKWEDWCNDQDPN